MANFIIFVLALVFVCLAFLAIGLILAGGGDTPQGSEPAPEMKGGAA